MLSDSEAESYVYKYEAEDVSKFLKANSINTDNLLDELIKDLPWQKVYSKDGIARRSSCWMTKSPCNCKYDYGNSLWTPTHFTKPVTLLAEALAKMIKSSEVPDGCNANLYEGPSNSLGWHADNEDIIIGSTGEATIISISFGLARYFELRKLNVKMKPIQTLLGDLDVLVMDGKTQLHYEHRVPATDNTHSSQAPRVNLTFRFVKHRDKCPSLKSS